MDYKIRLATLKDAKNLAILKQTVWDETYRGIYDDELIDNFDYKKSEKSFLSKINDENLLFLVVESNNNLVGYMSVGEPKIRFKDYEQELNLLYLRKDFQRRGIGKKLFSLGVNKIKKDGFKKFFVSCNQYNTNACKFYEAMGGKIVAHTRDSEIDNKRYYQVKYHFDIK